MPRRHWRVSRFLSDKRWWSSGTLSREFWQLTTAEHLFPCMEPSYTQIFKCPILSAPNLAAPVKSERHKCKKVAVLALGWLHSEKVNGIPLYMSVFVLCFDKFNWRYSIRIGSEHVNEERLIKQFATESLTEANKDWIFVSTCYSGILFRSMRSIP